MGARSDAVAATRARITGAAMELHAERGVRVTGWDDIAEAAAVSTATVYRHFPTLADLVPACARQVFDLIRPPTLDEAAAQFATLDDSADRLEHLARESCHCYRRGEAWLHAAYREREFVAELDIALEVIQGTLHVLVDAAAGGALTKQGHATLFTLCDFPFWKALLDAGLSYRAAEQTLVTLLRGEAHRLGLSEGATPDGDHSIERSGAD
jgi:AcrR family transcriptional regulator